MNAFELLTQVRLRSPRAAYTLLNRLVPRLIPLTKGLGVRVRELDDRRCVVSMPLKRRTRNHVGSVYFGAQMSLADITIGVLLFHRFPMGPYSGLIKTVQADFRAKAKGAVRCECELPIETIDALERVRTNADGKAEAWVPAVIRDSRGTVVTEIRFLVALKRF